MALYIEAFNFLIFFQDQQVSILAEILKVIFNITIKSFELSVDEEDEIHYTRLVTVLHDLLLMPTRSSSKKNELHNHIVNMLTCVPYSAYSELCPKIIEGQDIPKKMEYDGLNMEAVYQLKSFLKLKLEEQPVSTRQV